MPHLDDGRIQELLDGEIPSAELAPLQAHLAACDACRARLGSAQALLTEADDLIAALDQPVAHPAPLPIAAIPRRRREWIRTAAWAASLVIAAGAGYLSRTSLPLVDPPRDPMAATSDVVESPVALPAGDPTTNTSTGERSATTTAVPPTPDTRERQAVQPLAAGDRAAAPAERSPAPALSDEVGARAAEPTPARIGSTGAGVALDPPAGAPRPAARRAFETEGRADAVAQSRAESLHDQAANAKALVAVDTVAFAEAIRRLGGSLKLIDGLIPVRLEAAGDEVRVVYRVTRGEVSLAQRRVDGAIVWRLITPPTLEPDSLAALRARVQE